MMTVAAVAFSVNIVALSLESSQFGPRLWRNVMSDRGNQVVLGTFRGEEDGIFVPQISVSLAILLSLASVGVLIYCIHYFAVSMRAPVIIQE